jgi:hypothetical protein
LGSLKSGGERVNLSRHTFFISVEAYNLNLRYDLPKGKRLRKILVRRNKLTSKDFLKGALCGAPQVRV